MIKKCKLCGKEFQPKHNRQAYCYDDHYFNCKICGKRVLINRKYYNDPHNVCDSKECISAWRTHKNIEKYGCKDPGNRPEALEKRKATCLEKYGVDNPSKAANFKAKASATFKTKYGVAWITDSEEVRKKLSDSVRTARKEDPTIVKRTKQTCLDKYGVENPMQLSEFKEKSAETRFEKYGQYWSQRNYSAFYEFMNNPDKVSARTANFKATLAERYGVSSVWDIPGVKEKVINTMIAEFGEDYSNNPDIIARRKQTCLDKYGVPYPIAMFSEESLDKSRETIIKNRKTRISNINVRIHDLLVSKGIKCDYEFHLGRKWYDLSLIDTNILLEIDPTYTHSSQPSIYGYGLSPNYHILKTQFAIDNGFRCIHIYDWDNVDKICDMLKPKHVIYARNCVAKECPISECNELLDRCHLQGKSHGVKVALGLYYQNKLVEVMTFGKPRYNKKYDYELLRLCTESGISVVGGASKLLSAFKNMMSGSIISYCDRSKFDGSVYYKMGFTLDHISDPAKVWSKEKYKVTDNLLRQRGFDQLFRTHYGKGTSNEELMIENGWRSVYDCGQLVFVLD